MLQTTLSQGGQHSHSPVKESRLQRETSAEDVDGEGEEDLKLEEPDMGQN